MLSLADDLIVATAGVRSFFGVVIIDYQRSSLRRYTIELLLLRDEVHLWLGMHEAWYAAIGKELLLLLLGKLWSISQGIGSKLEWSTLAHSRCDETKALILIPLWHIWQAHHLNLLLIHLLLVVLG